VERLIDMVKKDKEKTMLVYNNHDSRSATAPDQEVIL